jgi:peptide deformylase
MLRTYPIITYPNPSLQKQTARYSNSLLPGSGWPNKEVIFNAMHEALAQEPNGIALAANQIEIPFRIFVVDPRFAEKIEIPNVIVNPEWSQMGRDFEVEQEGCLSFPGLSLSIKRALSIDCTFEDENGITHHKILSDLPARMFQHECEHLDGKLFTDNLPRIERFQLLAEIRKRGFRARTS